MPSGEREAPRRVLEEAFYIVTRSHEPSYYEIALTNRQVLTVFVILLICVVTAFFAGVWVGREGGVGVSEPELAEVEGVPEDEEGRPLRELRFFTDKPPADTAPKLNPETTLLADLGGVTPETGSAAKEQAPADISAEIKQEASSVQIRKPATVQTAGEPSRPETEGLTPDTGILVIQVFFSSDEDKAQNLVDRLGSGGFPAFLSPVEVGGETMYRVRLGPYNERPDAEAVATRVRQLYKLDTWITQ